MAVTRFASQVKPTDSTESVGYKFFPVAAFPKAPVATDSVTMGSVNDADFTQAAAHSGPWALTISTTSGTVYTHVDMVPYDLDTSATCYVKLLWSSSSSTTTKTAAFAVTYLEMTADTTVVAAPTTTCGSITNDTVGTQSTLRATASAAMSTSPTPGNMIYFGVNATAETTVGHLYGVQMIYTRRFV